MFVGSPIGAALVDSSFLIRAIYIVRIAGTIIYYVDVWAPARGGFLAPFVNGRYIGRNLPIAADGTAQLEVLDDGNTASIYFEDAGSFAVFAPGHEPDEYARLHQEFTAKSSRISWPADPVCSPLIGDNQLSEITVTGAVRGHNCFADRLTPTRGRIGFSILTNGTSHEISAWSESPKGKRTLVAWGARTGNGAVTLDEVNDSNLTITAQLLYANDLQPGNAFVELAWDKTYEIHISPNPLTFPRDPEYVRPDKGSASYSFLAGDLPNGTIHYAVVGRSDEGILAASPVEAGTLTIRNAPAPPTNLRASGTAAALLLEWDAGESGCSYLVSTSDADCPVNYGSWSLPLQNSVAVDVLQLTLAPLYGYAPIENTTDFDTLKAVFDTQTAAIIAAYNAGYTGFAGAVNAALDAIQAAIVVFCGRINYADSDAQDYLAGARDALNQILDANPRGDAAGWTVASNQVLGQTLIPLIRGTGAFNLADVVAVGILPEIYQIVGLDLSAEPPYIQLSQGISDAITAGDAVDIVPPDETAWMEALQEPVDTLLARLGTLLRGQAELYQLPGIAAPIVPAIVLNLYDAGAPYLPRSPKFRFGVQAIKGGVTEQSFQELEVEFNGDGSIRQLAPNAPTFTSIDFDGLKFIVEAVVLDDDSDSEAKYLDLFIVPQGDTPDFTTPSVSATLAAPISARQTATLEYTVATAGPYDLYLKSRNQTGQRSAGFAQATRYITTTPPPLITPTAEVSAQE